MAVEDVVFRLGVAGEALTGASTNQWVYDEAEKMLPPGTLSSLETFAQHAAVIAMNMSDTAADVVVLSTQRAEKASRVLGLVAEGSDNQDLLSAAASAASFSGCMDIINERHVLMTDTARELADTLAKANDLAKTLQAAVSSAAQTAEKGEAASANVFDRMNAYLSTI